MVYSKTQPEDLILRDLLARDRTILANERTLLAYIRTAFGFVAGGISLLKLFPEEVFSFWFGSGLIVAGGAIAVLGVFRFATVASRMNAIVKKPDGDTASNE